MQQSPKGFLSLVFALSLPFWFMGIVAPTNSLFPFGLPISALMAVCPMLAAITLTARQDGWQGARGLLRRAFDVRRTRSKRWLLLSAFIMPAVMVLSWCLMQYLSYSLPEPHFSLVAIPMMLTLYWIGAIGEELGWMGYLFDPLQERMGALSAALVIGVAWQVWHVVPFYAMGRSIGWISAQFLVGILMRIIIVWLYNKADRSVFAAVVFHASINVAISLFPNKGSHYDPAIAGVVLGFLVVGLIALTRTNNQSLRDLGRAVPRMSGESTGQYGNRC